MRIERIDDKTVKCFLSKEELEEYDISYKDFVLRNEKSREVMEEIMAQAAEEVGFQPPQFAMELQIMQLPEDGMILTFSEKAPEDIQVMKDMKECLLKIKDALGLKDGELSRAIEKVRAQEEQAAGEGQEEKLESHNLAQEQMPVAPVTFAVFVFDGLRAVCEYARVLPANLRIRSALYEMNGKYYLHVDKGAASYERYSRACIRAMEFGELYTAEDSRLEYLMEHGTCLISDHAVQKMKL